MLTARNAVPRGRRSAPPRPQLPRQAEPPTLDARASRCQSMPEIEYVRTYAQVAQIQLRSVLDALTEQVDRLGSLPQAAAEPVEQPDPDDGPVGEPDWQPSTSETSTTQPR